ncbi:pentatricopeptide repeat-containing protein At1g03100, mitochondrial [Telopea speciosissima]|uniref:pentatricopeptide repeat-containing protein At1g03100, mitochondrial n=1 Tax=Telopea speciosissima TaxID=54955 RepID=UPI001CC41DA7|nr:pentatricopeptide repeat-containing protein At1g03100, mitochondrial [Telopea speciosissima]
MLSVRKFRYRFTPTSSALASLINDGQVKSIKVSPCRPWASLSHRSLFSFMESCPSNSLKIQTSVVNLMNGFIGLSTPSFSSMAERILVQARDPSRLCAELGNALDESRFDDAWKLHQQYMQMEGLPRKSVLNKLLTCFAERQDLQWLEKAYNLVELIFEKGKPDLLEKETLIYLAFSLAKHRLPVPASTVLRKLVEMEVYPPVNAWSAVIAHMSQIAPGAYLSAELVLEIGYLFQDNRVDPRKKSNRSLLAMKPNTTVYNIALAGCLLFGTTRKAEQLLEVMPRVGVKADASLLVIMAQIYERNGRREELKKLKGHFDKACSLGDVQFQQFYNCLLTCHLNFGDLVSASQIVLEMLRKAKEAQNSLSAATLVLQTAGTAKSFPLEQCFRKSYNPATSDGLCDPRSIEHLVPPFEEFSRERHFLKLENEAKETLDVLLAKLHTKIELVTSEGGILRPTERIYAKLVKAFLEADRVKDLAEFLIRAAKEDVPVSTGNCAVIHVINACISLGWLDQAYDLLDEMRFAGVRTGSSLYSSLLKAYCEANRPREVESLLRDARKAGIQLDSSCYEAMIQCKVLQKDTQGALDLFKDMKEAKISKSVHQEFEMLVQGCAESREAGLMAKLLEEIKEGQRVDCGVHDWNSVIHFFSRKRLMHDAEKALKKMRALGHVPNAQTFHSMVTGYAAIGGKYLEVTELWGEMKVLAASSSMTFDQELLDSLLYTFVRGGFFLRANEVVEMMEEGKMFVDKYKYRNLFLKYHKTAYKKKAAPKIQTEAQCKRREAALTFKKWVGLV